MAAGLKILRCREGLSGKNPSGAPIRIFEVVTSRVPADAELREVASAKDPLTSAGIPSEGSAHPEDGELLAGTPTVHCQGIRIHGKMIATRTNFFHVSVPYFAKPPESAAPGDGLSEGALA